MVWNPPVKCDCDHSTLGWLFQSKAPYSQKIVQKVRGGYVEFTVRVNNVARGDCATIGEAWRAESHTVVGCAGNGVDAARPEKQNTP
jgi:hypothetical protein